MQVTFYLSEASANTAAGPFNISGTTSGGAANTVEIQANVSKAVLLTGYTEEIANNITGGTVTSTGDCTTTDTWDINELFVTPTPTPLPTITLNVRARDLDTETPGDVSLFYIINGGPSDYFPTEPFPTSCGPYGTINGLEEGDVVVFSTDQLYNINGADSITCPDSPGSSQSYSHTVTGVGGEDYVSFTINSGIIN